MYVDPRRLTHCGLQRHEVTALGEERGHELRFADSHHDGHLSAIFHPPNSISRTGQLSRVEGDQGGFTLDVALGRNVLDAGESSRPSLHPQRIDRLAADVTQPIRSGRHALESSIDLPEVRLDLPRQRRQLSALESNRLALGIVLVIGVRVARRVEERGHVFVQPQQALTKIGALLVKTCSWAHHHRVVAALSRPNSSRLSAQTVSRLNQVRDTARKPR